MVRGMHHPHATLTFEQLNHSAVGCKCLASVSVLAGNQTILLIARIHLPVLGLTAASQSPQQSACRQKQSLISIASGIKLDFSMPAKGNFCLVHSKTQHGMHSIKDLSVKCVHHGMLCAVSANGAMRCQRKTC
eukprot:TRINITY_DN58102_c0_g1_i1.p1 TRINITY_DN58102_c0_g1~~TRINITY_DN58102_c0_g1_i1.p1  ORF type:complete len:133 (+),score=20.41 TRINITY_DN58102_c0_g1_i1:120-518(+)